MILKLEKELYKSQGYKDFYSSIYKQLILKHLTYRHLITFRPFCLQTQAICLVNRHTTSFFGQVIYKKKLGI